MQDRYAGDVGDFGKLALLRQLARTGVRIGVCWYLTSGEGEANDDGKHTKYVDHPERFRHLDVPLFEELRCFLNRIQQGTARRSVADLEGLGMLPRATLFHGEHVPVDQASRPTWADEMVHAVSGCGLVFLDPDNGLGTSKLSHKSVTVEEIALLLGRPILLYHHQTRMKGGAPAEFKALRSRLLTAGCRRVDAIRLRPYSSRFYLLLDGTPALVEGLRCFSHRWGSEQEFFPDEAHNEKQVAQFERAFTAHHEAAHAVADVRFEFGSVKVDIRADGTRLGGAGALDR
ncbi:hypothetical protein JYT22_01290, partial [Endomicrobium sp. AH-315-J14]|nr:hypothetical protein [Endomicrobium sp. AH-315-J14]